MPLSEHEQRLLEQMERALYAEDPKFATALQRPSLSRASRGRMVIGAIVSLAGLALLIAGVATKLPVLGVLGFLAMLGGVVVAFTGGRGEAGEAEVPVAGPSGSQKAPKQSGGFMDRMEDRWRHRREGDQQS